MSIQVGDGSRTISYETLMLSKGLQITITEEDFYVLDNGNKGVYIEIPTTGEYKIGSLILIMEYPQDFPDSPPKCYIENLRKGSPHVLSKPNSEICYMNKNLWNSGYSSFEAGYFIKTWIYGYSSWVHTGKWKMPEAGWWDYIKKAVGH